MTDELNRSPADPERADPELLSGMLPTEANAVTVVMETVTESNLPGKVTVEPIPDWLKPMEEDDDDVENEKTTQRKTRKANPGGVKVKRGRGRPPLPKTVRARLNMIKALQGAGKKQKKSAASPRESTRSRLSSRIAALNSNQTPEVLPGAPQRVSHSLTPKSQKLCLTPLSPTGTITILPATEFCSPPRLTRVSPLIVDTAATQIPSHLPFAQLSNASQHVSAVTPGNNTGVLSLHLWQCPSQQPISSQDTNSDQTELIRSSGLPNVASNGGRPEKKQVLPLLSDCAGCCLPFPAENFTDTLCHRCKPEKKQSPPNIVFRKVGQNQWEVGQTKHLQEPKSRPKYKKVFEDFVPDCDDDDDDDELGSGSKKRNRRMCRQCAACLRQSDCGECDFCKDKPKFGGHNKKRQKCRLRQCQFQSKHYFRTRGVPQRIKSIKHKFKKRGRPRKTGIRRDPWENEEDNNDYVAEKEDETPDWRHYRTKGTSRRPRKWNYSFKEHNAFVEAVIDAPDDLVESDELLLVQNEPVKNVVANHNQQQSQEIYYTIPGVSEVSPMLRPLTVCNSNLDPVNGSGPGVNQNEILQIEMVRVGSPVSQYTEPQNTAQLVTEPPNHTPVITQIFTLAVGTEADFERDPGLMELFSALRQTVLPAYWVGVLAKGPILQLLQCSKLSTMADTVVQIDKGFFYQISVQNQPLLLTHSIYTRHPIRLTSISEVVSLLLDLEHLSVCQGHQSFNLGSPSEPRMFVRAALCDLLIPKDEEHCEKCSQPSEV